MPNNRSQDLILSILLICLDHLVPSPTLLRWYSNVTFHFLIAPNFLSLR